MSEAAERQDTAARAAAIEPGVSILLEAPAGSGKTAVLTQRFLRLLCTVEDPGEILAITFTRKAAAEMRTRVIRALRGELAGVDADTQSLRALAQAALAHGAARGWRLDAEPQSLRIQTIDSFNFWLASQLPVASRAGGTLRVTESAAPLYQHAARRTLRDAESDPALAADARLLFERLDNHWMNLERLIAQMLHERGHWLSFVASEDPAALTRRVNATLAALTRLRLAALCELIPQALRRRAQSLPGCGALGAEPAQLAHWKHFAQLALTRDDWRHQLSAHRLGSVFADRATCQTLRDLIDDLAAVPGTREALLALRRAPPPQLPPEDAAALEALSRLLRRAAAELHREFATRQRVDYTYIAGAARAALTVEGEPTDLALRTGLALRHILVDEFQDTSLAQVQLLEMLTVGWDGGDGRTLFVVGDPMQSIYRFRDAEVGLFLRARDRGIGDVRLQSLRLVRNFRAAPQLVSFANEAFAAVFPRADDLGSGAVSYRPSLAAHASDRAAEAIAPVTLQRFANRSAEAQAIAARVATLRQLEPCASVAVLVAAHAHAVPVIDALAARGLPALGVDLVPLRERMVVRDLVQLTRALYDRADRAAWLAVLRAPWCGARLQSLTALSALDDRELIIEALSNPQRLARCDPAERPRLARVHEILTRALAARGAGTVADWLESTWLQLGASDAYRADELADARAFFDAVAARAAALEWRGAEDLGALLENLYSAPPASDDAVQVMTIHRAKGLEFDHVVVPALDRATRGAERRLLRWIDVPTADGESNLLMAPTPAVDRPGESDLDAYLKDLLRQRDSYERGRLLYVAATRARRTVWLSAAPAVSADGVVRPDRRSLLAPLWPVLADRFETIVAADEPPAAPRRAQPLTRLAADWQPAALPPALPLARLPAAYLASEPPEFSWVGETQRHIGTVVHGWLERLAQLPTLPVADSIAREEETVHTQLVRLGVPPRERSRAVGVILEALRRTLADQRGRWILAAAHREARSEWQLSGVTAGRLRSLKIDRSFVDESGVRWVIDFKTSAHEGSGLEAFLEQEMQRYRPQLQGYAELAAALGPEPVRAALYFPLLGAFRELT